MTLPGWLLERLENHRRRYAPIWQGFLSDHLPMAAMALVYQSTPRKDIEQWMDKYQQQLEPAPEAPVVGDWHEGIGTPEAYGFLLTHFDAELSARGEEYVLHKYLPELISGWVRDAFHPLIRLGYARRFGCHTEISAGLAYLTIKGPDPRLEAMAQAAAPGQIAWPPAVRLRGRTFDERLQDLMSTRNLAVAVPEDVFATYARDVLEIFNASHDFFALHLVTATHAFLLATEGLDVAGAPALERGIEAMPIDVDFEHYVKFAFALEELGGMLDDASYRKTAEVVRRNLPSAETGVQQVEQALAQRGAEGASRQGI